MDAIRLYKALGDDIRLRIVRLLQTGSMTVNEILFIIGGNQPNISHHLKILLEAGVADSKKEGSWIYYRLSTTFKQILEMPLAQILHAHTDVETGTDDKKKELVYEKRKSIAEEYFNSIEEGEEQEFSDFMENIFSTSEIESFIEGSYGTIADIGCGNGRNLPVLANYADNVIGVDSSVKMLRYAEHLCMKHGLQYTLEVADISSLPFSDGAIDAALVNMVLHHLPDPSLALAEVARVIRKGGELFLIDFLEHNDENLRDQHADLWLGFSRDEICSWLAAAGMQVVKEESKQHDGYRIIIIRAHKPV